MSDSWLEKLTNKHVRELTPYESARRLFSAKNSTTEQQQIWLNANESPNAEQYALTDTYYNRYPDCQPDEVISAYASYAKLQAEQIVCTRGADEGIELIIRAFCEPGHSSVLICPPTYGMYAISAQTFNVGVERAALNEDFSLDISAMADYVGKVNVVFLCSPNNPTGTRIKQSDIVKVLEMFAGKALVVLDEAYIEFDISHQQTALLDQYPNLLILRTLSKAFALAGIRCGFVLSSRAVNASLMKVIAPYPVSAPVAQIAAQALSAEGLQKMQQRVENIRTSIDIITKRLSTIEEVSLVGNRLANFVLFRSKKNPQLMQYLVEAGVIIRDQSKQLNLQNCLRITAGTESENTILMRHIEAFFEQAPEQATKKAPKPANKAQINDRTSS